MASWRVARVSEIPDNAGREFLVGRSAITVWRVKGRFYATAARCPHEDAPLCAGHLEGGVITCPMHGWQFDVASGRGVNPSHTSLSCYKVVVKGDEVFVEL